MDLQETSPIEDFQSLFRHPFSFFNDLTLPESVDFWVLLKAIGGAWASFCLLQWASLPETMASSLVSFQSLGEFLMGQGSSQFWWMGPSKLDEILKAFESSLPLLVGVTVFKSLLIPFVKVAVVFILAFGIMLMLPLLGVPMNRVSYFQILAALSYCQWFSLFYFIPVFGTALATLALIFLPILSIKSIFGLSFLRAYASFLFFPLCLLVSLLTFGFFAIGLRL
jgi:hypothetical protein